MGAWARAGWRVWDLGNAIMLQKLFNPEWQITSKSFLLSSFLIFFSFSPTAEISRLELEFEESLPRKTTSKRRLDRSQMAQPIKKNKFSYFARSRLRLRPQEIWERDYTLPSRFSICTLSIYLYQLLENNITMRVLCSFMIDWHFQRTFPFIYDTSRDVKECMRGARYVLHYQSKYCFSWLGGSFEVKSNSPHRYLRRNNMP